MPSISTISPSTFDDGKPVTLTGSGFGASQGQVLIGGVAQNVNTWSDDEITFTTVRGSQSLGACRVDVVRGAAGSALFSDDFATGNLSKTENGVSWGSSANTSVVSSKLRFYWSGPSGNYNSEQRFTTGTSKYPEFWIKYDLTVDAGYSHVATNNKGFLTLWSNTSGSNTNDGYSQSDELLVGFEFWPNDSADGGSKLALRVFGSGYDYNYYPSNAWQNAIAVADRGQTITIVAQIKLGTYAPANFNGGTTGDAVARVWKNGSLIMSRTDANIYKSGFAGWNRGYLFGWANTRFASATELLVDNVQMATSNIFGVS